MYNRVKQILTNLFKGEINSEKAMATHPSTLAWRIPWTEEPGGLQFTEWQELDTTEAT